MGGGSGGWVGGVHLHIGSSRVDGINYQDLCTVSHFKEMRRVEWCVCSAWGGLWRSRDSSYGHEQECNGKQLRADNATPGAEVCTWMVQSGQT